MGWIVTAKILANACLFCGAAAWGWSITYILQRRPKELRELRTALQILETEITYAATPLPEAFQLIKESSSGQTAAFFERAAVEFERHQIAGLAWQRAVDVLYQQTAWNREDRAIIVALAPTLGLSDKQDQLKHLRLCQERLSRAEESAAERVGEKVRLYRSLGILTGLLLVLLAW